MFVGAFGIHTAAAQTYYKDNRIIRLEVNGPTSKRFPMISSMWISGLLVVPHQHAGADFQMSARSALRGRESASERPMFKRLKRYKAATVGNPQKSAARPAFYCDLANQKV